MNSADRHSINLSTKGCTSNKLKFQLISITLDFYKSNQYLFSMSYAITFLGKILIKN